MATSLRRIEVTANVYTTCLSHALLNEKEEILGLLLGDIEGPPNARQARVWCVVPLIRVDRRKDRTETSPEQISRVTSFADRLTAATGTPTRIIGWYHSHPHIAVLPSSIDLRTQLAYQQLDPDFFGLIFSVFEEDASKNGAVRCIAFQTGVSTLNNGALFRRPVPLAIASALPLSRPLPSRTSISPFRTSDSLSYVSRDRSRVEAALNDLVALQQMIMEEERLEFDRSLTHSATSTAPLVVTSAQGVSSAVLKTELTSKLSSGEGGLKAVHHLATYQRALTRIMEIAAQPMLRVLQDRTEQARLRKTQYSRALNAPAPVLAPRASTPSNPGSADPSTHAGGRVSNPGGQGGGSSDVVHLAAAVAAIRVGSPAPQRESSMVQANGGGGNGNGTASPVPAIVDDLIPL